MQTNGSTEINFFRFHSFPYLESISLFLNFFPHFLKSDIFFPFIMLLIYIYSCFTREARQKFGTIKAIFEGVSKPNFRGSRNLSVHSKGPQTWPCRRIKFFSCVHFKVKHNFLFHCDDCIVCRRLLNAKKVTSLKFEIVP